MEVAAVAGGPVENEHGVFNQAVLVKTRCSDCPVMNAKLGRHYTRAEMKIPEHEVGGLARGKIGAA